MKTLIHQLSIVPRIVYLSILLFSMHYSNAAEIKLLASDGATEDHFGCSVSISGDYAIVGARYADPVGSLSGSAYIFKRDGNTWTEQTKLIAGDAAAVNMFGYSVSISGDYAIVGSPQDSYGSAYIFMRQGTDWVQVAKLTANDAAGGDAFGVAVCIDDDYAIIGAFRDDDGASDAGSAYIFKREGTNWVQTAKLTASDPAYNGEFGKSVSISGEYAIVGFYGDDDAGSLSGSAFIFKRNDNIWSEHAKLTANDATADSYFGWSVSISGNYAIVGAYHDDHAGDRSGSAYIFERNDNTWVQIPKLIADIPASNDHFGFSVAIDNNKALVGAINYNSKGAVYVFVRNDDGWGENTIITPDDGGWQDMFGVSVAIAGDYALTGADEDDDLGINAGSAFIFDDFILGINDNVLSPPIGINLEQNYPNPFSGKTTAGYTLQTKSFVVFKVLDITGKEITTLVNEKQQPGKYEVEFNADGLPTGVYYYRLTVGKNTQTKKMIIQK